MDNDLISLLEQAGFTQKESIVYLALLELGQGDVTDIAKKSQLKRSIIYVIVEGLIEKGYVSQLPGRKVNTYQALDPSVILSQLKTTTKYFLEMLPFLRSLRNKGAKKPKIHYLENKEAIGNAFEDMSHAQEGLFLCSYARIEDHFPGAVDKWVKIYKRGIYKLKGKHIVPDNHEEKLYTKQLSLVGQQVRMLAGLNKMNMDFALYDNKLAITLLEEDPFMIIVESQEVVDSLKIIFEIAWQKGKYLK